MPHVILCPQCRQEVSVPDHLVGQTVRCPRCGATFEATLQESGEQGGDRPGPTTQFHAQPASARPSASRDQAQPVFEAAPDVERARLERALRPPLTPHRGPLILVLGILSIVLGCVGLILGPIAWIMGTGDLREMDLGRMDPEGEGLTNAGRICGIIGTCLHAASTCCCGASFLFPVGFRPARFR